MSILRIDIAQRFRPFSRQLKVLCPLPFSSLQFEVFPCLIKVSHFPIENSSFVASEPICEMSLNLKGPISKSITFLDLEKYCITVEGQSSEGFFRYHIKSLSESTNSFAVNFEKIPTNELECTFVFPNASYSIFELASEGNMRKSNTFTVKSKRTFALIPSSCHLPVDAQNSPVEAKNRQIFSRLSLGSHKIQDIDLIRRRQDLTEILPLWHRLGHCFPQCVQKNMSSGGNFYLLYQCLKSIANQDSTAAIDHLKNAWNATFDNLFVPFVEDVHHLGLNLPLISPDSPQSPLNLITQGAKCIEMLFYHFENDILKLLPALPPEFHCGRLADVEIPLGTFSMEWTKKKLRRFLFNSSSDGILHLELPKNIKAFRLRKSHLEHGQIIQAGQPIEVKHHSLYFLDKFN